MTQIRCRACGTFFDKKVNECPSCLTERRPVNVALASQAWRSNLQATAQHAIDHT